MKIGFDPVQQEVWNTVRAINDTWTRGDPDELVNYFHSEMIAITPTDRFRREGGWACIAGWKGLKRAVRVTHWEEIDPVIRVYGDSAVVAYYYTITFEDVGRTVAMSGRDMFFFIKENEQWWAVADHYSPFPS